MGRKQAKLILSKEVENFTFNGAWSKFSLHARMNQMVYIGMGLFNCVNTYATYPPEHSKSYGGRCQEYARHVTKIAASTTCVGVRKSIAIDSEIIELLEGIWLNWVKLQGVKTTEVRMLSMFLYAGYLHCAMQVIRSKKVGDEKVLDEKAKNQEMQRQIISDRFTLGLDNMKHQKPYYNWAYSKFEDYMIKEAYAMHNSDHQLKQHEMLLALKKETAEIGDYEMPCVLQAKGESKK